ncbi:MAG: 1-deoxy-D-xylulose-5-phosphate synthase N-terminal domain-containing protein [Pseudonocardiaceae bacterium]
MSLLGSITGPPDLKELSAAALVVLAQEIRAFLIDKVSGVGGHLGPNLGVVELTIAAHRVFDSPRDVLLFDTGHQAYVHKILTGRRAEFDSLRQAGGLSGYPAQGKSGTLVSCRWCPGCGWPRPGTAHGCASCSARPSTSPTGPP